MVYFFSAFSNQKFIFFSADNSFKIWVIIVNAIMLLIMLIFSIGTVVENSMQKEKGIKNEKIYSSILSNIDEGYSIIRNKQIENLNVDNIAILESDYRSAIYTVMGNLLSCLCEISQIERERFVITYFYKTSNVENWSTISSDEGFKGLKKSFLISNIDSVVNQLINRNDSIFYSSKNKAAKEKKYIPDNRDKQQLDYNSPMGSIFGANWKISDYEGNCIFDNVIVIGTYGKEICTEKDVKTKKL